MREKKYTVWQDSGEARTKSDEVWTEKRIIAHYNSLDEYDPQVLKEFDNEQEAMGYYNSITPTAAQKNSTSAGCVLTYDVIGVSEGDDFGFAIKTAGENYNER